MKEKHTLVILASGASSRFWPLGQDRHKTLYPVYLGSTVFRYTLEGLLQSGWRKVIITAGPRDIESMRRDVPKGMEAVFAMQENATGQGDAVLRSAPFINEEAFYLTTADKLYAGILLGLLDDAAGKDDARSIHIATVGADDPREYGIALTGSDPSRIRAVIEKPPDPGMHADASRRIVGAYRLTKKFLELLETLPSEPYSFEKALDAYAHTYAARSVPVDTVRQTTFKYPWHLLEINRLLMQSLQHRVQEAYGVEEGATLVGPVHLEKNVYIARSAVVRGPCVIREGAVIGDFALVRNCSYIGRNVVIGAHSEVKNSIICDNTKLHNAHALDSIIDENCNLGAGTRISNSRFDGKHVTSIVKGEKISTHLEHFGIVMGRGSRTATLANFMPGVKIGRGCLVGGSFDVIHDIADGSFARRNKEGRIEISPIERK